MQIAHGTKPWEHKRWRGGTIRPSRGGIFVLWFVAAVFCGVGVLIYFKEPDLFRFRLGVELWLLMFPAVGLIGLAAAVVKSLRAWRFRGTEFRMSTVPGVIGGKLRGELVLPDRFAMDTEIQVVLINERKTVRHLNRGKSSSSDTDVSRLWEHRLTLGQREMRFGGGMCVLPIEFTIPYKTKDETDNVKAGGKGTSVYFRWLLKATCDMPGMDLDVEFNVPVYRTEQSDPNVAERPKSTEELKEYLKAQSKGKRISVGSRDGRKSYVAKAWPGMKHVAMMGIIGGVFGGAGVFLVYMGISSFMRERADNLFEGIFNAVFAIVPLLMSVVFLGIGLLMLVLLAASLCRRETWIANGHLHHRRTFFGFSWKKRIPCNAIERIVSNNSGNINGRPFFNVELFHRAGRLKFGQDEDECWNMTLAGELDTKAEAEWLVQQLNRCVERERSR